MKTHIKTVDNLMVVARLPFLHYIHSSPLTRPHFSFPEFEKREERFRPFPFAGFGICRVSNPIREHSHDRARVRACGHATLLASALTLSCSSRWGDARKAVGRHTHKGVLVRFISGIARSNKISECWRTTTGRRRC